MEHSGEKINFVNKLNDDCLRHIFMELPIRDRMRIERVCTRWRQISQQSWSDIKSLELHASSDEWRLILFDHPESNTELELRHENVLKILNLARQFVRKICILYCFDDDFLSMTNNLRNLQCLRFDYMATDVTDDFLDKLVTNNRKLTDFAVVNSNSDFSPNILEKLGDLPVLENLILDGHMSSINNSDMSKMTTLKSFYFNCDHIGNESCISLIENAPHLKLLEIGHKSGVRGKEVFEVANRVTRARTNGVELDIDASEAREADLGFKLGDFIYDSPLLTICPSQY